MQFCLSRPPLISAPSGRGRCDIILVLMALSELGKASQPIGRRQEPSAGRTCTSECWLSPWECAFNCRGTHICQVSSYFHPLPTGRSARVQIPTVQGASAQPPHALPKVSSRGRRVSCGYSSSTNARVCTICTSIDKNWQNINFNKVTITGIIR